MDVSSRWTVVLLLTGLLVAVGLLHHIYFVVLPRRAMKRYTDPEQLLRYLERVVATPSLCGPTFKIVVRSALMEMYCVRGRYAEAVVHCRALLAWLAWGRKSKWRSALEADARRFLADSLEALGQVDEAVEERSRAAEDVDQAKHTTLGQLTQGKLLERQHQYEEAYAAYEKALELTPLSYTPGPDRIECMLRLALSAYAAGRPADSLRWAEETIAMGVTGALLRIAHTRAGLACASLGQLEESEQHYRRAYATAAAENNRQAMAEALSGLARANASQLL